MLLYIIANANANASFISFQSSQITDAVVVARILNATLVVPELDHHSFWKDDRLQTISFFLPFYLFTNIINTHTHTHCYYY